MTYKDLNVFLYVDIKILIKKEGYKMIKVDIERNGDILTSIEVPYNTNPSSFLKKRFLEGINWGIDYDSVPQKTKREWFATDIFWRLFRALHSGIPVIIGKKIYKCDRYKDKNEIYEKISHISRLLDKFKSNYWLDEQNKGFVTVIFK